MLHVRLPLQVLASTQSHFSQPVPRTLTLHLPFLLKSTSDAFKDKLPGHLLLEALLIQQTQMLIQLNQEHSPHLQHGPDQQFRGPASKGILVPLGNEGKRVSSTQDFPSSDLNKLLWALPLCSCPKPQVLTLLSR